MRGTRIGQGRSMLPTLRVRVMLTVVVAVVVAAVPVIAQGKGDRSSRDEGPERVAILPFGNISGVPDDDWIGAGIAEALSGEFQDRSAFDVIGRGRVSETMRIVGVLDTRPAESGMLLRGGPACGRAVGSQRGIPAARGSAAHYRTVGGRHDRCGRPGCEGRRRH